MSEFYSLLHGRARRSFRKWVGKPEKKLRAEALDFRETEGD